MASWDWLLGNASSRAGKTSRGDKPALRRQGYHVLHCVYVR
jgi:hypothetical protein